MQFNLEYLESTPDLPWFGNSAYVYLIFSFIANALVYKNNLA